MIYDFCDKILDLNNNNKYSHYRIMRNNYINLNNLNKGEFNSIYGYLRRGDRK